MPIAQDRIKRLLVANRGEIAIRVLRAASELQIRTVALYTYADRYSLHRYKADEAYLIGSQDEPLKPYLDLEEIISLAKKKKVDAIHPGYGFLSENKDFVKRCEEENIVFIGPSSKVMSALGNKTSAKVLARSLKVPVINDTEVLDSFEQARKEAEKITFPLMVKARSGGGGRGMRVVKKPKDLEQAFFEAQEEAKRAFGDPGVFLEKYIENPKHLEVQILGDSFGNLVHLYERDCSVQRRFQKVVEIGPSLGISSEVKSKLYEYALKICSSVNYSNAGTVEFLIDQKEQIYFIEVNPRIQVEHTVTEEVTGVDLVRSQILISAGLKLKHPLMDIADQSKITCQGYAIQCRITTEDPENNFTPDYGKIIAYRSPGGFGIRLDAGSAYAGVVISPYFDSLLVKVTGWGRTLEGAAQKLSRALAEFRVRGLKTNIPFLENVISNDKFQSGRARIDFIDSNPELFQFVTKRDRATKVLRYLAEVAVNGNSQVGLGKKAKDLPPARVPEFDRYEIAPSGTKQVLDNLGPERFIGWLKDQKQVLFTDTTFRDAHQSLLATRVRTFDLLNIAKSFAFHHPQLFSMEVWGGATFDVALRFLKECPWERLRKLRQAIPNILLQMLFRGSNGVGYKAYPDNLIEKFIEQSAESGVDVFRIFDSMNWMEAMKVSIQAVRERTNSLAEVCICYTGDILDPNRTKFNLSYYLDLAKAVEDSGAHILAIKDMAGLLKPKAAEELIAALKETISLPIHLHTHDTSSIQASSYLRAIEAGVDVVDCALASMSGLTSQPNFNSVVAMLEGHERAPDLNLDSLNEFSNYWEDVRKYYYPFETELKSGTAEVYDHEIPGGQYSNLRPQARALGLEDRFEEVKKNYITVNKMLGDLIKVTPSSKVVGDFALYMTANNLTEADIYERGPELSFPDSLKSFFRGELGQPTGGFPKKLQEIVLGEEKAIVGRPNDHLGPINFELEFQSFQKEFLNTSLEDFLSFKLYPKVFPEYYKFKDTYGDVSIIPTPQFFFELEANQEVMVEIDRGKTLVVHLVYVGEANEEGLRSVFFKLNGQSRVIEVLDRNVEVTKKINKKASTPNEIAAPLQGRLSKLMVSKDDQVSVGQPLFLVEAMKMETVVNATMIGSVNHVELQEGDLVEAGDLVLVISE